MATLTEGVHALEFLLSYSRSCRSFESGVVAAGQVCLSGQVLGRLLGAAAEVVTGDGDGTISAITVGANAQPGVYTLTCTAESANAGTFSVRTPGGYPLPDLTVGVAYASTHINLTVGDGAEDWDTGDVIEVTVTGGNYSAFDPSADDGSQIAAAVLGATTDATESARSAAIVVRD
ncbi:MAG: head decoration protein, partial [Xanthomonadales bacterium]|nr:head decoration protein [Xanthomonadales bacterium]